MKNKRWIYGIFIIAISFTIYSCGFYKTIIIEEVSPENLKAFADQKQFVTLQNGEDGRVYLIENYRFEDNIIKGSLTPLKEADHPQGKASFRHSKSNNAKMYLHLTTNAELGSGAIELPFEQVTGMNTHENDTITSLFATGSLVVIGSVVAVVAFVAIACNCPYVATINKDGTQEFQGSLFPGSIFKPLERKDHLVLNNVASENGEIEIKIYNELDEVQYIDDVNLLAVSQSKEHLGLLDNRHLITYNDGISPTKALTHLGNEITEIIINPDEKIYEFNDPALEKGLNSIELEFPANKWNDNLLFVVQARQTELLEHTAEVFFQQFGTSFPDWVERMNEIDASKYNNNAVEQGIFLNVYYEENGKWIYQGNYSNVGALSTRNLAIPLEISKHDKSIKIKLEAAYGLWALDQVSIVSDWATDMNSASLELLSAVNQDQNNVTEALAEIDENYVVQNLKGSYTNLKFRASSNPDVTYVLQAKGYYNHERDYQNPPNKAFLRKMNKMKYSTHHLAQKVQLYKELHIAANQ